MSTFQYVRTEYHSRRESQYMDKCDISLGTVHGYFLKNIIIRNSIKGESQNMDYE